MGDPTAPIKAIVQVSSDIMKLAKDNPDAQEAGRYAAKSLKVVAQTVNTALLPLAAVNYGVALFKNYIETKFSERLESKLNDVPPENIVPPKPNVAGPALQALTFAHDEPNLEEMYVSLIASAMNSETASQAHPAFVEVIKQLDAAETPVLNSILGDGRHNAIVEVQGTLETGGYRTLERNVIDLRNLEGKQIAVPETPARVDNWVRLGLVSVSYDEFLTADGAYDWSLTRPEYVRHSDPLEQGVVSLDVRKGFIRRSDFGSSFAVAVGVGAAK